MSPPPILDPSRRSRRLRIAIGIAAILGLATIALRLEGHRWWCRCGRLTPWSGDIHSEHNSQHLVLAIYRDNLALNLLILIYPLASVKSWQMGH